VTLAHLGVRAMARNEQQKSGARSKGGGQDRVLLLFWTNAEARKQLKYIAIEEDLTQQRLLAEALNLLFRSRGKPTIG
jgi:hypothetical protein